MIGVPDCCRCAMRSAMASVVMPGSVSSLGGPTHDRARSGRRCAGRDHIPRSLRGAVGRAASGRGFATTTAAWVGSFSNRPFVILRRRARHPSASQRLATRSCSISAADHGVPS